MLRGFLTLLLLPNISWAALTSDPTSWSNFTFVPYKWGGKVIYDHESSRDPSHGTAHGIAPASIDIASCSADGSLPGVQPSAMLAYYDDGAGGKWLALRMRLNDSIIEKSTVGSGYVQKVWNFLIDIDNDGYKEYLISVDGKYDASGDDRVFLYYNNSNSQEVTVVNLTDENQASDRIDQFVASYSNAKSHTRVIEDTSVYCQNKREFWLDVQIPLASFNVPGKEITTSSDIRLFMSTSTERNDLFLKDWMESVCTGEPTGSSFSPATSTVRMGSPYRVGGSIATDNGNVQLRVFTDVNGDMLLNKGDSNPSWAGGSTTTFTIKNSSGATVGTLLGANLDSGTDGAAGFTYGYKDYSLPVGTYYLEATTTDTTKSFTKSIPMTFEVGVCGSSTVYVPVGPFGSANSRFYFFAYEDLDGNGVYDKQTENVYPNLTGLSIEVNGQPKCTLAKDVNNAPDPSACFYDNQGANKKTFEIMNWGSQGYVPTTPTILYKEMTAKTPGGYFAFGFKKAGEISGAVFNDLNGDGYRNQEEPGISGVLITITYPDGTTTAMATTDSNGYYSFTVASNGKYSIVETDKSGYSSSTPNVVVINYDSTKNSSVNFGDIVSGKISGYVFVDINGDTRLQTTESKLSDVLISVFDANNELYASTRTDSSGKFNFDVPSGGYSIVQTTPSGYKATTPTSVSTYIPASGGATVVFGNIPYGTIINYAFEDKNSNTVPDLGEEGLSGLEFRVQGTSYDTLMTSANDGTAAYFRLTPLITYTTTAPQLSDYLSTDYVDLTPYTKENYLAADDAHVNKFGYIAAGTIAGTVFFDVNQNGVQDPGETGINGVSITIKKGTTVVDTVTTDFSGYYYKTDSTMTSGTYTILESQPANYLSTTPDSVTVAFTRLKSASANFGETLVGTISGQVKLDSDNDETYESTDSIIPGVKIDLSNGSSAYTDVNGSYSFLNVPLNTIQ